MAGFPRKLKLDTEGMQFLFKFATPVVIWEEIDGTRRPSDQQATNDSGDLLWNIECMICDGDEVLGETAVEVPNKTQPVLQMGALVDFDSVTAEVWSGKRGFGGRAYATAINVPTASKPKAAATS